MMMSQTTREPIPHSALAWCSCPRPVAGRPSPCRHRSPQHHGRPLCSSVGPGRSPTGQGDIRPAKTCATATFNRPVWRRQSRRADGAEEPNRRLLNPEEKCLQMVPFRWRIRYLLEDRLPSPALPAVVAEPEELPEGIADDAISCPAAPWARFAAGACSSLSSGRPEAWTSPPRPGLLRYALLVWLHPLRPTQGRRGSARSMPTTFPSGTGS